MSSTSKGHADAARDPAISAGGIDFSAASDANDDAPTIISKTHPTVDPRAASSDNIADLGGQPVSAGGIARGLRGRRLAHYELIEPIGVGGMAAVLRAHDTQLDRQVALKILPPEMSTDNDSVQRFHQEAKAAARLDHENIARVFFCGEDQGLHFIAFEFVEGDNLRTILDRRGRLPVAEAVRYVLQVATGLEHAAARGVVHRDVKPSNIIVSPNGRAKLVDMGLARNTDRRGEADLTHSGVTLGTFDYISPEQAMEPRDADARSDVYSLGCTFYHMLTGQPPVPEGTAAKKLHHHQHVAPVDPRQLNPDVPDEIALILGRMMAKDPKTRYQRPLLLVQHLMQVARKVGAADDLPEGVLFVDTPLPTAPRSRPLLIVSLAVLALGIAITLMALAPAALPPAAPVRNERPAATVADTNPKGAVVPIETVPKGTTQRPLPGPDDVIRNAAELARVAQDPGLKSRTSIKLSGRIDVTEIPGGVTLTAGPALVIESDMPSDVPDAQPATLVFRAGAATHPNALVIAGGKVTFKNVKIEVAAEGGYPAQAAAAVAVRGAEKVSFIKCIFEQKGVPPFSPSRPTIASVLVDGSALDGAARATAEFQACYFTGNPGSDALNPEHAPGGQVAVAVDGPANIGVTDCGFRPHGAFFQMRDGCTRAGTVVRLDHCSGFVFSGPVFRFEQKAGADLFASDCLFSRSYDNTVLEGKEPNLIRQPATPGIEARIAFHGKHNGYHHLNAFWSGGTLLIHTLEQFKSALRTNGAGEDVGSIDSALSEDESPWNLPREALRGAAPHLAFQVRSEFAPFGLRRGYWGALAQPAVPEPVLAAKVKLFDPDYTGKRANVFNSLERALANMDAGETLLVKARKDGREIELPPTTLKAGVDVLIKAFDNHTPVFALGNAAVKKDVAFFRLLDGKLRVEGVEFLLEPRQDGAGSQSLVLLGDNAYCAFDRCVVTLKASRRVPLSVVSFVDPKELMRTDQPRSGSTQILMSNSLVRGDGDLVGVTSCRPFKLTLQNSLFVLTGSLLNVQARPEEVPVDLGAQVELSKVSAFTREPTFALRSYKAGKGLARTQIEARECLFAPLADCALVLVEANDIVSEDQLVRYLDWKGEKNCFANFARLLEHERPNEMGSAMQLEPGRWEKLFVELNPRHEKALIFPAADEPLWQATPVSFRPVDAAAQLGAYGASGALDSLLKVPAAK